MSQISEVIPILFFSIIFAFFSHTFSTYDSINKKYITKDKFFYSLIVISLIIFAGLRETYNDTVVYIWEYEFENNTIEEGLFSKINYDIGSNPGFWISMGLMKTIGVDTNSFILIFSFLTLSIYCWFIHKYTDNILFSTFLMLMMCYTFTFAAIKQCFAMAICLVAVDKCINKKYIQFLLCIGFAVLFHPYAIMFLVAPFLFFKPWTKKTYFLLIFFAFIGFSLQLFVGRIIDITSMIGESYNVETFSGEGVNPMRVCVHLTPLVLSFLVRKNIPNEKCTEAECLCLNLTLLNGELMFVGLFGTANYFGRLANYFSIFPVITIPWLFKFVDKRYRTFLLICAISAYMIFFYFENTISGMNPFNEEFRRITLWEYFNRINLF